MTDDLISRADAIKALGECPYDWCGTEAELQAVNDWELYKSAIEAIPSAQPKIVRCKECKFCSFDAENDVYKCSKTKHSMYSADKHFCSYGEREGE